MQGHPKTHNEPAPASMGKDDYHEGHAYDDETTYILDGRKAPKPPKSERPLLMFIAGVRREGERERGRKGLARPF